MCSRDIHNGCVIKVGIMHICSNWWVMAGGFSHPLLNPCAVKTIIMVVFSKLVVIHICSDWWVMVGGFPIHFLIHVQSRQSMVVISELVVMHMCSD